MKANISMSEQSNGSGPGDAGDTETVSGIEEASGPAKWKVIGPGLVVAATGVGAADMVATLVAGSQFGYGLLWAVIVGVILKIVLVEGAGRFSLATGKTIFEGGDRSAAGPRGTSDRTSSSGASSTEPRR